MRGRVMALYGMIFRAGPALGAVLMGSLSERFGLRLPLAIGAVMSVAFCVLTWGRQRRMAPLLEHEPPLGAEVARTAEKGSP
jgi:predicted MFS family arabinose efflux permease